MGHEGVVERVSWGLVVTSDSVYRGEKRDEITPLVEILLKAEGHTLDYKTVVPNSVLHIQYSVLEALLRGVDVVLVTGGTGPRPLDVSVDAIRQLASRELPGIGEEFRRESLETIGKRALLSRAGAYIVHNRLVVVTPGSPQAVEVMLAKVLFPIIGHLVHELKR